MSPSALKQTRPPPVGASGLTAGVWRALWEEEVPNHPSLRPFRRDAVTSRLPPGETKAGFVGTGPAFCQARWSHARSGSETRQGLSREGVLEPGPPWLPTWAGAQLCAKEQPLPGSWRGSSVRDTPDSSPGTHPGAREENRNLGKQLWRLLLPARWSRRTFPWSSCQVKARVTAALGLRDMQGWRWGSLLTTGHWVCTPQDQVGRHAVLPASDKPEGSLQAGGRWGTVTVSLFSKGAFTARVRLCDTVTYNEKHTVSVPIWTEFPWKRSGSPR